MVQILPPSLREKRPFALDLLEGAAYGLNKYLGFKEEKEQKEKEKKGNEFLSQLLGQDVSNLPQEMKQEALKSFLKSQENERNYQNKLFQNQQTISGIEKQRGLEPGSLGSFVNDPSMAEKSTRPKNLTQSSQPIDPEQLNIIRNVRVSKEFLDADPEEKYRLLTDAGVSRENAKAEADLATQTFDSKQKQKKYGYELNKDFINKTSNDFFTFEKEYKPRLQQLQELNSNEELMSPTAASFAEKLGIPISVLSDNASNELYEKVALDMLKGLPETFGSRIMKVEVENFLKTLPRLTNSPEGRRMITSNMLKLGEMKESIYNNMRTMQLEYEKQGKALPYDFQQKVLDSSLPHLRKLSEEFSKLSSIQELPPNHTPFFAPDGNIIYVDNDNEDQMDWVVQNGGKRIW